MKKRGFTLAEVLIAMGLVGVIAAMTIPTFVTSSRQQANEAKVASTISDLENVFGNMIVTEDVDLYTETAFYEALTEATLSKYLKLNGSATALTSFYSSETPFKNGENSLTITPKNIFQVKNGALLIFESGTDLYIDVNGATMPNGFNKDLYKYEITENGFIERVKEIVPEG